MRISLYNATLYQSERVSNAYVTALAFLISKYIIKVAKMFVCRIKLLVTLIAYQADDL